MLDPVPVLNSTSEVIPGFALMRRTGVDADGRITVARPNADGRFVLVNGPMAIPPGKAGVAPGYANRNVIAYDPQDGTPAVGETWGAAGGQWTARKNKAGFVIDGGAGYGAVNAVRQSSGFTSPLTTKGDIWGFGSLDTRIPVGSNGQVLTADSAQPLGVKWTAASGSDSLLGEVTVSATSHTVKRKTWSSGIVDYSPPTIFTNCVARPAAPCPSERLCRSTPSRT